MGSVFGSEKVCVYVSKTKKERNIYENEITIFGPGSRKREEVSWACHLIW